MKIAMIGAKGVYTGEITAADTADSPYQEQRSELSKKLEIVERFERTMKNKA